MDPKEHIDHLIARAQTLLAFMPESEAVEALIDSGVEGGEAYLAVAAAKIANKDIPS